MKSKRKVMFIVLLIIVAIYGFASLYRYLMRSSAYQDEIPLLSESSTRNSDRDGTEGFFWRLAVGGYITKIEKDKDVYHDSDGVRYYENDYYIVDATLVDHQVRFRIHRCIYEWSDISTPQIVRWLNVSFTSEASREEPYYVLEEYLVRRGYSEDIKNFFKEWLKKYKDRLFWDEKEKKFILRN